LKDVLRRFELWHVLQVSTNGSTFRPNLWNVELPITFGAPVLRDLTQLWMRSNKITKISDMFRFTRGSIRWTIVVSSSDPARLNEITMTVAHVPNTRPVFDPAGQVGLIPADNNGYAVQEFSLKQNNINTIEFPHYNLGRYAWNSSYLLSEPLLDPQKGLGSCFIRFSGPDAHLTVKIYRALGDDVSMYVFNGCPRRITDSVDVVPYIGPIRPTPTSRVQEDRPDGLFFPDVSEQLETVASEFAETNEALRTLINKHSRLADSGNGLVRTMEDFIKSDERLCKYADVALQLIQVLINPCLTTFTVSAASVLLKIIPVSLIKVSLTTVVGLAEKVWGLAFSTNDRGDVSEEDIPFVGSFWSCVCEFFGLSPGRSDPMARKIGALFKAVSLSEKMFALLEALVDGVKIALNRLYAVFYPDEVLFKVVTSKVISDKMREYILACGEITNPKFEVSILASKKCTDYIFELYDYGEAFKATLPKVKLYQRDLYMQLIAAHVKLSRLANKCVQSANKPLTRFEPFVLYVCGNPGVGKSFELDSLIYEIVGAMDVKVIGDPVFTKSPATEWMDGWNETKLVIKYDDFNIINEAEPNCIAELINLKSSAVYVGNFSDTIDKQRCVHPRLVAIASNQALPTHNDLRCPNAAYRRRDLLLEFNLAKDFVYCQRCRGITTSAKGMGCGECRALNVELIRREEHIIVIELDVMSGSPIGKPEFLAHWKPKIVTSFKKYQEAEWRNYHNRVMAHERLLRMNEHKPYDICITGHARLDFQEHFNGVSEKVRSAKKTFDPYDLLTHKINFTPIGAVIEDIEDNVLENEDRADTWLEYGGLAVASLAAHYVTTNFKKTKRQRYNKDYRKSCICQLVGLDEVIKEKVIQARSIKAEYEARDYIYNGGVSHMSTTISDYRQKEADGLKGLLFAEFDNDRGSIRIAKGHFDLECVDCMKFGVPISLTIEGWDPNKIPCACSIDLDKVPFKEVIPCGRLFKLVKKNPDGADTLQLYWPTCPRCLTSPEFNMKLARKHIQYNASVDPDALYYSDIIGGAFQTATKLYAALVAVRSLYRIYKNFRSRGDEENAESSTYPVRPGKGKGIRGDNAKKSGKTMRADGHMFDIQDVVAKNYYKIEINHDGKILITYILMVKGEAGVMTTHAFKKFLLSGQATITAHGQTFNLVAGDLEGIVATIEDDEGRKRDLDITMVNVRKVPPARDITHHFIEIEHLSDYSTHAAFFNVFNRTTVPSIPIKRFVSDLNYGEKSYVDGFCYDFQRVGLKDSFFKGACMSLLIDNNQNKIIGLHVATRIEWWDGVGISQMITQDFLRAFCDKRDVVGAKDLSSDISGFVGSYEDVAKASNIGITNAILPLKEYLIHVGNVQVPVRHAIWTEIKKSPMYGLLGEPIKRPVRFLTEGEPVPGVIKMSEAVAGNRPDVNWSRAELDHALDSIKNDIVFTNTPNTQVQGFRSFDEAVMGNPVIKHMPGMDLNTSTGFPLNYEYVNKKELISVQETSGRRKMYTDENLRRIHEDYNLMRASGNSPPTVFHCVLKDERKSPEKIEKPRLIQAGPIEHTIASRRLTMDFVAAFYDHALDNFSAVGVNCLGPDWQKMTKKLRWHNNIICGDVKNFGPTLPTEMVKAVYTIINAWYEQYDKKQDTQRLYRLMRNAIRGEVTDSLNVAYNTVFQTMCCSPSGQPLTVVVNTICMYMYVYMAYRNIMLPMKRECDYAAFKKNVDCLIYGDDIWISVSDTIKDDFNNLTLARCFQSHGVMYTDIDKQEVKKPFVTLSESSFLGRTPHLLDGTIVGVLDEDLISDIVNWTKCKNARNIDGHMLSTTQSALIEYMFYGEKKFREAFRKLNKYWVDKGINLNGYTYTELFDKWRNNLLGEKDALSAECACPKEQKDDKLAVCFAEQHHDPPEVASLLH
jgi:hypothetical protein